MTFQEVLDLINAEIVANGNQEITADVLRPILVAMLGVPNDAVGDLGDLNTTDISNIVNAINSILSVNIPARTVIYPVSPALVDFDQPELEWVVDAVNNTIALNGSFTVNNGEQMVFSVSALYGTELQTRYYRLTTGATVVNAVAPGELMPDGIRSTDVDSSLIIDLGDIGAADVWDAFNSDGDQPFAIIGDKFVQAVQGGESKLWQWIGGDGNFGNSATVALAGWFVLLTDSGVPVSGQTNLSYNPATGEVSNDNGDGFTIPEVTTVNPGLATPDMIGAKPSELEKITEGGKTGWRIRGFDPANYGNIGERAIDFSFQEYEGDLGATGDYSHAEGYSTSATGDYSHAEGFGCQADGVASHAEGVDTFATGDFSHAEGDNTKAYGYASHAGGVSSEADSFAETVLGCFAEIVEANNATAWDADDYVFRLGIGLSGASLADGFRVKKNGEVTAPGLDNDKIIEDKSLITKEYYHDNLPSSNFLGRYTSLANLEAAHPTATPGNYAQVDEGVGFPVVNYNWDEQDGWVVGSSGSGATTTDELPEGATNLYHTGARVRDTPLTGLSTATVGAITATDKVIEAFGKIQNALTNIFSASVFGAAINALTSKTTPVDADGLPIYDSAASNAAKKLTWANLKATLKAYFDTVYIKGNVRVQAAAITTMASSTTYYIGGTANIVPTTASRYKMFFPVNATSFRANVFLYVNGSGYGSGENIQVVLHDVTTNTSHTIGNVSITGHSQGILATVNATVIAGNEFEIRLITPSFGTSPQQVVAGGDIDFF